MVLVPRLHMKHLLFLVGGQSLWGLEVRTSMRHIQESSCTSCFALTHLIILGKTDKSDWITTYPRPFWIPTDY